MRYKIDLTIGEFESAHLTVIHQAPGDLPIVLDKLDLHSLEPHTTGYAVTRRGGSRKALRVFETFAAGIDALFAVAAAYIRGERE